MKLWTEQSDKKDNFEKEMKKRKENSFPIEKFNFFLKKRKEHSFLFFFKKLSKWKKIIKNYIIKTVLVFLS